MADYKHTLYVVNGEGKNSKPYSALVLQTGDFKKYLSFDRFYICSLLDCSPTELLALPLNQAKIITRW